ncbi:MAG: hypothetical protein JXQ96_21215 [Cyclobacteriaceae bacterium]
MRNYLSRLLLVICLLFSANTSWSQFSGQNIAEFQLGQIPSDTDAFASLYDRLVMNYDINKFKVGMTMEQYWTPYSERNYIRPNQFRLQYKSDSWDVKVGNFYETLGRGTMMRTYQVPGAILEDVSFRSRNYFHRDFLGAFAKYQSKKWSVKALAGQPLNNVFPPGESYKSRRPDSLAVLGGDYQIKTHKIEYNAMYLKNSRVDKLYSMTNVSGKIAPKLSYYTELVLDNKGGVFGSNDSYGWYLNLNLELEKWSLSAEVKDYNDIIVGEAVNEPPALIKQHVYRLLNRSTHVPFPINETGWQIEASFLLENEGVLTFNHARAHNPLTADLAFTFTEYFFEYSRLYNERLDVKFFMDYANDDTKGESDRISAGVDLDLILKKRKSINIEYEFQTFQRPDSRSTNMLLSLAYNMGSKFTGSILTEYSTDNTVIETGSDHKFWLGGNVKYKPTFNNTFLLFVGTRRGGPACTSGVCYEILDFEGMELRYTQRF